MKTTIINHATREFVVNCCSSLFVEKLACYRPHRGMEIALTVAFWLCNMFISLLSDCVLLLMWGRCEALRKIINEIQAAGVRYLSSDITLLNSFLGSYSFLWNSQYLIWSRNYIYVMESERLLLFSVRFSYCTFLSVHFVCSFLQKTLPVNLCWVRLTQSTSINHVYLRFEYK
jgi:hypothetical protein